MRFEEIQEIIQSCNSLNEDELSNFEELSSVVEFIKQLEVDFSDEIQKIDGTTVRYCDYYNNSIHGLDIIEGFMNDYNNSDKEEQVKLFSIFVILKNMKDVLESFDCFSLNEINDLLELYIFDSALLTIELKKTKVKEHLLDFLSDNKYKVLFSGYSFDDISSLDDSVIKSLINMIKNKLSKEDIIPLAENIECVKSSYNVNLMRVHLADDYRVAFMRKNAVTTILGVDHKSGKNSNYTRYYPVAKRIDDVEEEINKLNKNELDHKSNHFKVVKKLKRVLIEEQKKSEGC